MNTRQHPDRSLGELIADLGSTTTTLLEQQLALARVELGEKVTEVGHALAAILFGALVMFAGLLVLLDALVLGLAELFPAELSPWLPALLVGASVGAVGVFLLARGKQRLDPSNLKPERTTRSLSADKAMIEEQLR